MQKELLFLVFICLTKLISAQSEADTTILFQPVEITSTKANSPGLVINKTDSLVKTINQNISVAEILSQHSHINIRNYGNGLLSTINARGLGANHTSVLWNGVPLNSPNLGLTDLSLLPGFLFDEISVISGGTGTSYGNNSMGVAIELQNYIQEKSNLTFSGMKGSYGTSASNIKINFSSRKISSTTAAYFHEADNNFKFHNISKPDSPIQMQRNAHLINQGIIQFFNYQINNSNTIRSGLWLHKSERELPPLMFVNVNDELQQDKSVRSFIEWKTILANISFANLLSYSNEVIFYNNYLNGISGESDVKNYRNELILKYFPARRFSINSNITGEFSAAEIKDYTEKKKNTGMSVNIHTNYTLSDNWKMGAGFRKEFTELTKAPIAFSAGTEGKLTKFLILSASVSQVYTLPTLNDLYWQPGGNPDLKPETGYNSQINLKFKLNEKGSWQITGFYSLINDWIQWNPVSSGIYSPVNIKEVESKGIETNITQEVNLFTWKFKMIGNYSFTDAINKSFESNPTLINKQLIFVPAHMFNLFFSASYKSQTVFINNSFTGTRYTTADNSAALESYNLINTGAIINFAHERFLYTLQPEIKNIFDISYQPIPWRAMPGRSYFLTLKLNLNLKSN